MGKNKDTVRERIIQTTTQLIIENNEIKDITIREIAAKSKVGVGSINYHFQTKENLIDICILRIISQFINEIEKLYENLDLNPIDKLRYVFKTMSSFLVQNPSISKTSMILDLNTATLNDNTHQASNLHFKALKDFYGEQKNDYEIFVILHIIMSSIQVAFLRNNTIKADAGLDFFDEDQRDYFIDNLIDRII